MCDVPHLRLDAGGHCRQHIKRYTSRCPCHQFDRPGIQPALWIGVMPLHRTAEVDGVIRRVSEREPRGVRLDDNLARGGRIVLGPKGRLEGEHWGTLAERPDGGRM